MLNSVERYDPKVVASAHSFPTSPKLTQVGTWETLAPMLKRAMLKHRLCYLCWMMQFLCQVIVHVMHNTTKPAHEAVPMLQPLALRGEYTCLAEVMADRLRFVPTNFSFDAAVPTDQKLTVRKIALVTNCSQQP